MKGNAVYGILIVALLATVAMMTVSVTHAQGTQSQAQNNIACQQTMVQQNQRMQHMETMDNQLQSLVTEMNQARGDLKIEAMAKVITAMTAQHREIRQSMLEMNEGMISATLCQAMQGMSQGMMNGMRGTMHNWSAPQK